MGVYFFGHWPEKRNNVINTVLSYVITLFILITKKQKNEFRTYRWVYILR